MYMLRGHLSRRSLMRLLLRSRETANTYTLAHLGCIKDNIRSIMGDVEKSDLTEFGGDSARDSRIDDLLSKA